jgi:hypothetical protein
MAIATGTAIALGAGAGLIGAGMSAGASRDAAKMQVDAARDAAAQERAMYEQSRSDLAPYREQGYTALKDIERMKPFLTAQFGPEQFGQYLDPSMAFRQRIGTQATERLQNIGGGAISGNTLRALQDYGQNLASTEYGNAFGRFQTERGNIYNTLANIAGMGQNAVNTGVSSGQNYASQLTGLTTGAGAAGAAGTVGAANAYSGALGNVGNMAFLSSIMKPPGAAVSGPGGFGNYSSASQDFYNPVGARLPTTGPA